MAESENKVLAYRVTYLYLGSSEIQTKLFFDYFRALVFKIYLERAGECAFVALNSWLFNCD